MPLRRADRLFDILRVLRAASCRVTAASLAREMTRFSLAANHEVTAPKRLLVNHFFSTTTRPGARADRRCRRKDRRHRPVPHRPGNYRLKPGFLV